MTGVLTKMGNLYIEKHIETRQRGETEKEDGHLQAKERNLEQILPSQPSEGTNPTNTWILDFQTPELGSLSVGCSKIIDSI